MRQSLHPPKLGVGRPALPPGGAQASARFTVRWQCLTEHSSRPRVSPVEAALSSRLRAYEEVVLDAWRSHLSTEGKRRLTAQLELLTSYQRQARERDLCFFQLGSKPGKPQPALPESILFPCKLESCVVALIHVVGVDKGGTRHRLRAGVHLHKGRIISIEFNQPPSKKLVSDVEITRAEILRDPMIPASEETVSDAQRREEVLKTLQSKLPDEYSQLVAEGKGVSVNEWEVRTVQDIWKHPKSDGNYYLLAEKEGMGAVGVKEDEFSGQLYYLDYDDIVGEKITVGLRKFLEEFDAEK